MPVDRVQERADDGRRQQQEGDIVVRLTSVEVRVMLAALNTALNRPALFRAPVLATAEDLSVRLIELLRATKSDGPDEALTLGDLAAPDKLPAFGDAVRPPLPTLR